MPAIVALSSTFAMKTPALFCSMPAPYDQCSCQMSSSPGDVRMVGIACGAGALARAVLHHRHARLQRVHEDRRARLIEPVMRDHDTGRPCPIGLFGHISSCSLFQSRSPKSTRRNWPSVTTLPTDWPFSGSLRDLLRRERRALRVRLAAAGQRRLQRVARRRHDPPVEAGDRDLVARLDHQVLRLAVQLGIGRLEALHLLALFDRRPVIDERARPGSA